MVFCERGAQCHIDLKLWVEWLLWAVMALITIVITALVTTI